MQNNGYLFKQFKGQSITDESNDPVKAEIERIAKNNGLTVVFNRVGETGGATVLPPENQVTITLAPDNNNTWRIIAAR